MDGVKDVVGVLWVEEAAWEEAAWEEDADEAAAEEDAEVAWDVETDAAMVPPANTTVRSWNSRIQ